MNFNTDDPLAELLSDNSLDNDSFFENLSVGKKPRNPVNKIKGKLEDLFGIKEEVEPHLKIPTIKKPIPHFNQSTSNRSPSINKQPTATSTPSITKQKPSQSNDDADSDDDDLGFDPKKPKAGAKVNLFDDILGTFETKRPATAASTTNTSKTEQPVARPSMSRQSTDTTTENSNLVLTQTRPKTATGRRSSSNSAAANPDPFGLFGGQAKDKEPNISSSGMSTPKAKLRGSTADWLGLSTEPDPTNSIVAKQQEVPRVQSPEPARMATKQLSTTGSKEMVDILTIPDIVDTESVEHLLGREEVSGLRQETQSKTQLYTDTTAQNIFLLNNMNMETKNSFSALQQQESQLILATQMKNQERALLEMQHKQETLLQQQERQFQTLLQQQLQRQHQMEEHITQQHQRINTHLQLMMTQPAMITTMPEKETTGSIGGSEDPNHSQKSRPQSPTQAVIDAVQMETDVRRLELEKLRLEELVANMKTNYESEIEMIESSYKKQLKFLEEHLTVIESRLRLEMTELTEFYNKKLESLENEKQKLKVQYEDDISTIKQDYEDELRRVKKSQEDDFEMLKEEHRRMLESIRQSKMFEFAAIQENGSYLETLKLASENLENLSGGLQGLRDDMHTRLETLNHEKEKKLEAREKRVEDAERRLKITEDTAEEEKRRLMDLVSTLELQMSKLSKESGEENWQLRQKMSALDAEKTAFEREKAYIREQLARDEKRIADLKELQLAETQKVMVKVQEERARLLIARTKIETERKLHPHNDLEKQHLEAEAIMKVAQDATRQADAERERYYKQQRQLEQQRREFIDKENMLRAKEEEIEQELNAFRLAEHKSQEAQQKAKVVEQNFLMKIQYLQQRMRELGDKEASLSQERVVLTQEGIALQNLKLKLSERKCTLCTISERNEDIKHMLNANNSTVLKQSSDEAIALDTTTAAIVDDNNIVAESVPSIHYRQMLEQGNIVDRMLDENIAESYRKMKSMNAGGVDFWTESVLDDDSKKLALHNLDSEIQYGSYNNLFNRKYQ